jgi:hypothetical protein
MSNCEIININRKATTEYSIFVIIARYNRNCNSYFERCLGEYNGTPIHTRDILLFTIIDLCNVNDWTHQLFACNKL